MICRVCKIEKQEEQFPKKTTKKDGSSLRNTICKPCQRLVSKKHYNENKDAYLAKNEKKKKEFKQLELPKEYKKFEDVHRHIYQEKKH